MKKLTRALIAFSLFLLTLCLLTACGEKLPTDYVKGTDVVIDNETPFVYAPETDIRIKLSEDDPVAVIDILTYVTQITSHPEELDTDYHTLIKHFGNKPVREFVKEDETLYYTVYSLTDNELLYLYLEKNGGQYLCSDYFTADVREDDVTKDFVLPQDLPTAILGDKLPSTCYLENYTPEEIAKNNEWKWSWYYDTCNQINIPHSINHDRDGVECIKFIRCIESVSFDLVRDDGNTYHGYYVYDLYVHENGAGVLYFYHLYYKNWLQQSAYHIIQEETIHLTAEEVASVVSVMVEQDFAHHPTWNPEEFQGFDGSSTDIFAAGNFGEKYEHHLISMWEPTARYPHYHIRTAIEDLVRAHVTVKEGRVYRPDLYEEYEWMQD